jgi:hypothetical protein
MTKKPLANYLSDEAVFATSLLTIALDQYGTDCLEWDPETLVLELATDFTTILPPKNKDKLNAVITAITTDQFYRDPIIFGHICEALNDDPVNFSFIPQPQPEEMAWAITEITLLEGQNLQDFSTDVRRYIGVILGIFGVLRPPDVLKIADFEPGIKANADANISNDPTMYSAFFNKNQADAEDIVNYIKTRAAHLIRELNSLPLENRDPESWHKFMLRAAKRFPTLAST